jgi:hypothetical protein
MAQHDRPIHVDYLSVSRPHSGRVWAIIAIILFCHVSAVFGLYAGRIHGIGICRSDMIIFLLPFVLVCLLDSFLLSRSLPVWLALIAGALFSLVGLTLGIFWGANVYGT